MAGRRYPRVDSLQRTLGERLNRYIPGRIGTKTGIERVVGILRGENIFPATLVTGLRFYVNWLRISTNKGLNYIGFGTCKKAAVNRRTRDQREIKGKPILTLKRVAPPTGGTRAPWYAPE